MLEFGLIYLPLVTLTFCIWIVSYSELGLESQYALRFESTHKNLPLSNDEDADNIYTVLIRSQVRVIG